jgi:hypothetical protein
MMKVQNEMAYALEIWFLEMKDLINRELDKLIFWGYPDTTLILLKKIHVECLWNPRKLRRLLIDISMEIGVDLYSMIGLIREKSFHSEVEYETR